MNAPFATESREGNPSARVRAWNTVMTASPGDFETTISASEIEGEVPEELFGGRLLSNGPGWTKIGGRLAHPFDGHGYLRSFRFHKDGSVALRARFVHTQAYERERAAGRLLIRGFATNREGGARKNLGFQGPPRNVANTTVLRWGDRLLAGWEGGRPTALDPESLATRGEETMGGALAGQTTLAHFKVDEIRGRLVSCSIRNGRSFGMVFREFSPSGELVASHEAEFPGTSFAHDFAMSPQHLIAAGNPLKFKLGELTRTIVGRSTLLNSLRPDLKSRGSLRLIRRDGGASRIVHLPGPAFVVHFANAFETSDALVVDACLFHHFVFGEEFGYQGPDRELDPGLPEARGPQSLMRITIPHGSDEAQWEKLSSFGVDFPRIHPAHEGRDTPAIFGATRADPRFSDPFDSLIRRDLHERDRPCTLWKGPEGCFVGEPIFVPLPGEARAGHVVALVSDGHRERTELVVLDALDLGAGPIARVSFPLLPVAFHGAWDPSPR